MVKKESDPFKKKVWDGLQLAYKVTANSVYGQMGASCQVLFTRTRLLRVLLLLVAVVLMMLQEQSS